jgi:hypothetical protein
MELISVDCIDTFDPPVVRVTVRAFGGEIYSFDIPSALYPEIGAPLGWPTNPCNEA